MRDVATLLDQARLAHDNEVYILTIALSILGMEYGSVRLRAMSEMPADEFNDFDANLREARRLAKLYVDPLDKLNIVDAIELLSDGLVHKASAVER